MTKPHQVLGVAAGIALGLGGLVAHARDQQPTVNRGAFDATYPFDIDFVSFSSPEIRFADGDRITISRIRGSSPHVGPRGKYLIEGTYQLQSMEHAYVGVGVPHSLDPTARADIQAVERGSGRFAIRTPMQRLGPFRVQFVTETSPAGLGGIYAEEVVSPNFGPPRSGLPKIPTLVKIDANLTIFVDGERVSGEQLQETLVRVAKAKPGYGLLIIADRIVTLGDVQFVTDACTDAGIQSYQLLGIPVVGIDGNGDLSFNRRPIANAELPRLLRYSSDLGPHLVITVKGNVLLERIAELMKQCSAAGFTSVFIERG